MTSTLDRYLESPEFQRLYAEEGFVNEALERVCVWMNEQQVTRAELARRLGTSRSNVTQMLNGRNVSLRTLAAAIHVMGGKPRLEIDALAGGVRHHFEVKATQSSFCAWGGGATYRGMAERGEFRGRDGNLEAA